MIKAICKKCIISYEGPEHGIFGTWYGIDEEAWSVRHEVVCPYNEPSFRISTKQVPACCIYSLEHTVMGQRKKNKRK